MILPWTEAIATCLTGALIFSAALYGLSASGHFPREYRAAELRGTIGTVLLAVSGIVVALSLAIGVSLATMLASWYLIVICGGVALLLTPLALARFSDHFVNGKGALLTFSLLSGLTALGLWIIVRT